MKYKNKFIGVLTLSLFLLVSTGCFPQKSEDKSNQISNTDNKDVVNQQPANETKQFLNDYEEVSRSFAVNHNQDLLVAIDIDHEDRFQLDGLEKKLRKKLNDHFDTFKIALSTDQKLLIELEQLENEIETGNITEKKIAKRIKKLKKLMKKKT